MPDNDKYARGGYIPAPSGPYDNGGVLPAGISTFVGDYELYPLRWVTPEWVYSADEVRALGERALEALQKSVEERKTDQ